MTARFGMEKVLVGLVLVTLIAIAGEKKILHTSLIVDARSGQVDVYDDSNEGGISHSEILDAEKMHWLCDLQPGHRWPFCGFEIIFDEQRLQGLDLRRYERIKLRLNYEGPTDTLRFYLRNSDPRYTVPGINDTTKYNQVAFDSDSVREHGTVEFEILDFSVANWWVQRLRLPPELTRPQFDNVVTLEVQTGIDYSPGEHRFHLEYIELTGQRLTTEHWYQLIVALWLCAALSLLAFRIFSLQSTLKVTSEREKELSEINALLDTRSRDLEEKARTDALTGAFNRQGLEEAMKLGLADWRQQQKPLSIVMLDLDHFKAINDTFGHTQGDRVLSEVSALIKQCIRHTDVFARWGGEEFILLCRNTRLTEAQHIAEKLRERIHRQKIGPENNLSASFGVATIRPGESLDQIFNRVDQAMYQAKHKGRNRVETSHP